MNEIITLTLGKSETDVQMMVSVDCYGAEPEVGIFNDSFEITGIQVLSFGDLKIRDKHTAQDYQDGLLDLVNRDAGLFGTIVEEVLDKHYQY